MLANELGNECIYEDEDLLTINDLKEYINDKEEVRTCIKAKDYILNIIDINTKRFEENQNYSEQWGSIYESHCTINVDILRRELKKGGFEFETVKKDWAEMGFLIVNAQGRYVHGTTANGKKGTYVKLII